MSLCARPHEQLTVGGATGVLVSSRRRSEVWVSLGVRQFCMCICVCMRWSVSVAELGLQPWGLTYPGASNRGDWDSRTSAEQMECMSSAAGSIHLACMHTHEYPTSGPPSFSAREGNRMRLLVLSVFVQLLSGLFVQWATYTCIYLQNINVLSLYVLTRKTWLASLLVGLGAMQLQQPHPHSAARSGLIALTLLCYDVIKLSKKHSE